MSWNPGPGTALFAEFFLKTTIILFTALLVAAGSKRRTAALRHYILSFALIGLLLIPILSFLPVGWRTPLLPARPFKAAMSEHFSIVRPGPGDLVLLPESALSTGGSHPAAENVSGLQKSKAASGAGMVRDRLEYQDNAPGRVNSGRAGKKTAAPGKALVDGVVVFLWLSGLALLFLRIAVGLAGAVRMTREGTRLGDPGWRILVARFLAIVSLRRNVRLRSHPEVVIPLTWGWRKPVILLPAGADAWAETERSSALFHELSHVKRADFLFMLLIRVSLAVFWWNPVCWIVYVRIRKEQEIACDELVLRAGIKPSTYAASLLAFRCSAGSRWNASTALPGLLGGSSFKERLAAILRQKIMIKEVKMKSRIMLAASVVLAVAFIGTARPAVAVNAAPVPDDFFTETASPSPAALSAAQETKTEKEAVQEKEQEKEKTEDDKEKSVIVKKVVVSAGEGEGKPVEITITKDGKTRKLLLAKPLTLKTDKDGRVIFFGAEGAAISDLKDAMIGIQISDDDLKLIEDGNFLKLDKNDFFTLSGDDGKILVIKKSKDGKPGIKIVKEIEIDEGDIVSELDLGKEIECGKHGVKVIIQKGKELLEKVRAIREQAEAVKAKKIEFAELEKSLEKLEAELKAGEEKIRKITEGFAHATGVWTVAEDEHKNKFITRIKDVDLKGAAGKLTVTCRHRDGKLEIVLTGEKGPDGRAAYDRAMDRLKKELAEGGKLLESNYDEEAGTMTFKMEIAAAADEGLVKRLVETITAEIKE